MKKRTIFQTSIVILTISLIVLALSFVPFNIGLTSTESHYDSISENTFPKIAFSSDRGNNILDYDIYVMNPDGSNQINITNTPSTDETRPSWSPDGSKILFSTFGLTNNLYTMNADGTELTQIIENSGLDHVYSPDGSKIAYALYSGEENMENYSIWVMNADGSQQMQLTDHPGEDLHPSWSPDGTNIVFQRNWPFLDELEIYSINIDGTGETNLTNNPLANEESPDYSPDGSKIAFGRQGDGTSGIWVMNPDGSNQRRLTKSKDYYYSSAPDWSYDGSKIVFISRGAIYAINSDGSCLVRLTEIRENDSDWYPAYQPVMNESPLPFFCLYEPLLFK